MCADFKHSVAIHLTERCVTEKINFFLDIDFKNENPLALCELLKEIAGVVQNEFTKQEFECIVSKRTDWKIHINYPGLLLTNTESFTTAMKVRNQLKETFKHGNWDWDSIIDDSVYLSGFRMLGCAKALMIWNQKTKSIELPKNTVEYVENKYENITGFNYLNLPRVYSLESDINP